WDYGQFGFRTAYPHIGRVERGDDNDEVTVAVGEVPRKGALKVLHVVLIDGKVEAQAVIKHVRLKADFLVDRGLRVERLERNARGTALVDAASLKALGYPSIKHDVLVRLVVDGAYPVP